MPKSARKMRLDLTDPETRRTWLAALRAKREVEQQPAWKRGGTEAERDEARRAFRERWKAFMNGGWRRVLERQPRVLAQRVQEELDRRIPGLPHSIAVADLLHAIVDDLQLCDDELVIGLLLSMHATRPDFQLLAGRCCVDEGWKRGSYGFNDMASLFGYADVYDDEHGE